MKAFLVTAICLALSATAALASPAGSSTYFVTVKVPPHASVESFVSRAFKETVTCRAACRVNTKVLIRAAAAKRLGFANVKGKLILIATNKGTLKARTPTRMGLVLTAEASKRLPKARGPVQIFGSVQGIPNGRPGVNYSVGWASTLTVS